MPASQKIQRTFSFALLCVRVASLLHYHTSLTSSPDKSSKQYDLAEKLCHTQGGTGVMLCDAMALQLREGRWSITPELGHL